MNEHRPQLSASVPSKDLVSTTTNGNGAGGKVPAPKPRNFFAGFRALTDRFDEQFKRVEELHRLCREERVKLVYLNREGANANDVRNLWEEVQDGARQCVAALQQQWSMIKNLEDIHNPPIGYFMLRIAEMVGKFPEEKLSTKEAAENYATGLAERLQAEDLSVMALESLFREIEDGRNKIPAISDVLPFLKKHKNKWQQRLDAINIKDIQRLGEEIIFAIEFKKAVFKEAVLEYLDAHGYTDLIDGVRSGGSDLHFTAIHTTAKTEGMTELVAELEAPLLARSEIFKQAREVFSGKYVRAEWSLRMLNARCRLNRGKSFACRKCGAGYDDPVCCKVCGEGDVVGIEFWDEHAARERQPLEDDLEERRLQLEHEQLQLQHEQPRRDKVEYQRWEQFTAVRYEKRRRRRIQQIEEIKWDEEAEQQEIERTLQHKMERALEEHWEAIASEYDPWLDADAETVEAFRRARPLSDEEFAELKKKAKREARSELVERTRRVIEEQRDEAMRDLDARLAEIEGWKNDGTIEDYSEVIDDLKSRVADLENRGGRIDI